MTLHLSTASHTARGQCTAYVIANGTDALTVMLVVLSTAVPLLRSSLEPEHMAHSDDMGTSSFVLSMEDDHATS